MKYALYIYSAWGIAAFALVVVTAYTWFESRRLRAEIKRLEARGIRRRSSETQGGPQI